MEDSNNDYTEFNNKDDSLTNEEKFLKKKGKINRIEKGRYEFEEMARKCEEVKDQALITCRDGINQAHQVKHALAAVLGFIQEKDYESAQRQWYYLKDELVGEMTSYIGKFTEQSAQAMKAYEYFVEVASDMIKSRFDVLEETKNELENVYDKLQRAINEALYRIRYYEEDQKITRYWQQ